MTKTQNRLGNDPLSWITSPKESKGKQPPKKKQEVVISKKADNPKTVSKFFYITEEHNEYLRVAKFHTKKNYNDLLFEMIELYKKENPIKI